MYTRDLIVEKNRAKERVWKGIFASKKGRSSEISPGRTCECSRNVKLKIGVRLPRTTKERGEQAA